ncbi:MAG: hypothetical protein FWC16_01955 [Defluviitaleaceae bacterium]|nr:hypothetical protein [Defluviitaleaceae bacterium]MCL2273663.1 hypothetical protein [Defluviitaleaceae bacterium]
MNYKDLLPMELAIREAVLRDAPTAKEVFSEDFDMTAYLNESYAAFTERTRNDVTASSVFMEQIDSCIKNTAQLKQEVLQAIEDGEFTEAEEREALGMIVMSEALHDEMLEMCKHLP